MFPNSFQNCDALHFDHKNLKMIKQLIHSAKIEKEIMLRVGLRTIDSHEVEEVDVLLDSGATGLFIDHAWLHQKKIFTRKLEHPIEVYNIDRSVNRGVQLSRKLMWTCQMW